MAAWVHEHECKAAAQTLQRMLNTGYVPEEHELRQLQQCRTTFVRRAVAGGGACMAAGLAIATRTRTRGQTLLSLAVPLVLASEATVIAARTGAHSCLEGILSLQDSALADEARSDLEREAPNCSPLKRHPFSMDMTTGERASPRTFEQQEGRQPGSNPITRLTQPPPKQKQTRESEEASVNKLPSETVNGIDNFLSYGAEDDDGEARTCDESFSHPKQLHDYPQRKREHEERRQRTEIRRQRRASHAETTPATGSY